MENKDSAKPKKYTFSEEELQEITSLYEMMREQYGYYPQGVDSNGNIMWGIILKSSVQLLFEKEADRFEKRGKEIMAKKGGFAEALQK